MGETAVREAGLDSVFPISCAADKTGRCENPRLKHPRWKAANRLYGTREVTDPVPIPLVLLASMLNAARIG